MCAFFGGRSECRIRKTSLPVVYIDFLSMYPSVNALIGRWRLVIDREIAIDEEWIRTEGTDRHLLGLQSGRPSIT